MVLDAVGALEAHTDLNSLWAGLRDSLFDEKIDFVIYITVDEQRGAPLVLTNMPAVYDAVDPATDPFLSHCCDSYALTRTGVDYLPDYENLPDYDYLPEPAKAFIQRAGEAGWRTGLGIPMRLSGSRRFGGFNIGSRLPRADFEREIAPHAEALRFLCLIAHRRIEEVMANQPPIASDQFRELLTAPALPQLSDLTDREREVAYLVAQGLSRKECARMCGISPNTVAEYLKSAYRKLGVRDRVALVRLFAEISVG